MSVEHKEVKPDWTAYSPFTDLRGSRNGSPHNNADTGIGDEDAEKEGKEAGTASDMKNYFRSYFRDTSMSSLLHDIDTVTQFMSILLPKAKLENMYGKYNPTDRLNTFSIAYSYMCFGKSMRIMIELAPESRIHHSEKTIYLEVCGETVDMIRLVDIDNVYSTISLPATLVNLLVEAFAKDQSNTMDGEQEKTGRQ